MTLDPQKALCNEKVGAKKKYRNLCFCIKLNGYWNQWILPNMALIKAEDDEHL